MIPKRNFILPAVSALAVGGVLWAAQGPTPLASKSHSHARQLHAKLAADPISVGGCNSSAGNKGLLSKPTPPTDPKATNPSATGSVNYTITFNDGSGLACYVWSVNGVNESPVFPSPRPKTTPLSHSASVDDTVMLFVVDGENGGKWDSYTWGPSTNKDAGTKSVVFTPTCASSSGQENLLFGPSGYGQTFSITYNDESAPRCWQWFVDGQPSTDPGNSGTDGGNRQTIHFSFGPHPPAYYNAAHTVMLAIVDSDKGEWDTYTWTKPGCYPPASVITASVNTKGEITGNLAPGANASCTDGKKHRLTATYQKGGPANTDTDKNGNFKFGGKPANNFPATVSFLGDDSMAPAKSVTCDYNTGQCN